jgi:DNA-binding NarL/FixJ family response regulator
VKARAELWTPMRSAVAACFLDGLSDKEAARAIGISPTSVQRQARKLKQRLAARSRTHLAALIGALAVKPLERPLGSGEPV